MAKRKNAGAVTVMDSAMPLASATDSARESHIRRVWLAELCDTLQATDHVVVLTTDEQGDLLLHALPQDIET